MICVLFPALHEPLAHSHALAHLKLIGLLCSFSLFLQKIDQECALVPRGALSLDTGKKVITNTNYQGLSYETSTQLRAFMHLRRPENLQGIALLKRPGILKTDDFLDCIDNDLPKGTELIFLFICLLSCALDVRVVSSYRT